MRGTQSLKYWTLIKDCKTRVLKDWFDQELHQEQSWSEVQNFRIYSSLKSRPVAGCVQTSSSLAKPRVQINNLVTISKSVLINLYVLILVGILDL